MKKTYISPSMVVVRLAMTQPLASSPTAGLNPNQSVNAGDIEVKGFNGSFWDDEW